MKLALEDFLSNQLRTPFPQKLVDDTKEAEVVVPELIRDGVSYFGPDRRKWHAQGDRIQLPSSQAKPLCHACATKLVGTGYTDGRWDHYQISAGGMEYDGFIPWDRNITEQRKDIPQLERTEFDDLWLPTRDRSGGVITFFPFWQMQRLPLAGDEQNPWHVSDRVIDLKGFEPERRPAAYA